MLQIIRIEKVAPTKYLVSFDRDGKILQYEFFGFPPRDGDEVSVLTLPEDAMSGLADYEYQPKPGEGYGAFFVPAVKETALIVKRVAAGESIDLPVVLDER